MPIYDCVCSECGLTQEQLLTRQEPPDKCPDCLGQMERMKVQKSNFALKGKGWASDGYSG